MQKEILIIILLIILVALFISIVFNFKAMLDLKWNIDYMISKDAVCQDYRWTKFEIEGLRYNLSNFLYNNNPTFARIVQDYKITYSLITVFTSLAILTCIIVKASSINYGSIFETVSKAFQKVQSKCSDTTTISTSLTSTKDEENTKKVNIPEWMKETSEQIYNAFDIPMPFLLTIIAVFIIHITITSRYLQMLDTIKTDSNEDNSANTLAKYYKCYKILSAIMIMSNIKNTKVEVSHPAISNLAPTFDQLLERNIASYENTNNTSRVKNIKLDAYDKLDFLKYFVFDQLSPYYLKYFDNVYVSIPSVSTGQIDVSQNNYLDDLYTKRLNIIQDDIKNAANNVSKLPEYNNIRDDNMFSIYMEMKVKYENDTITKKDIELLLKYSQYTEINNKIGGMIKKSGANIAVDQNDYIKYFIENKDILFDDTKLSEFQVTISEHTNVIYVYYVYFSVFFIAFSHCLYTTLEGSTYIYTLLGIIALYILFIWLYTQTSLMIAST